MSDERLLTLDDVAKRLDIHIVTVRRWARTGELNAIRLGGPKGYRVREKDLQAFLKARETGRGSVRRSGFGVDLEA